MRIGRNPEKLKTEKNKKYKHRVIVVFYIPNLIEEYYQEADRVLDVCLTSIMNTINLNYTAITLINNNSCNEVNWVIDKHKPNIDKYVTYSENKGKVYALLNEIRGVYEEFVTITDSDILFFNGWESAVMNIFRDHPYAGVVSPYPCQYYAFYYNQGVFGINSVKNNIGYGKIVADLDVDLYAKGTNLPRIDTRDGFKYNWKSKQFYIKNPTPAIIGAFHVVATHRTSQFKNIYNFPELKFEDYYERNFIDRLADDVGQFRLSTTTTFAYHMGNRIDDTYEKYRDQFENKNELSFDDIRTYNHGPKWVIILNRILGRVFIKFRWNKKKEKYSVQNLLTIDQK
jgi:hypothetical protein